MTERPGAVATIPVTLLVQIGNSDPQPVGVDAILAHGTLEGNVITFDRARVAEDTMEAILRIITHDKEVSA